MVNQSSNILFLHQHHLSRSISLILLYSCKRFQALFLFHRGFCAFCDGCLAIEIDDPPINILFFDFLRIEFLPLLYFAFICHHQPILPLFVCLCHLALKKDDNLGEHACVCAPQNDADDVVFDQGHEGRTILIGKVGVVVVVSAVLLVLALILLIMAIAPSLVGVGVKRTIILPPLVLIAQYFVSLLNLDELVGAGWIIGHVGVMLLGQLVIFGLYLLVGGSSLQPKRVVMAKKESNSKEGAINGDPAREYHRILTRK